MRRRTRARSSIPIPVLALVLAIPSQSPLSSFWLAPGPDGWTLIFRPALASAIVAPQGRWIWLAFQRDGIIDALAVEGRSGRVRAHIRMGTPGCCLPPPLAMTPDGRWALVGGDAVWVYSPELGKRRLLRIEPSDTVIALAIAPDGRVAAGVTLKGRVLLFDPAQGGILYRWDPAPGRREVPGIAFAPDGRELWIAWNQRLEAWSLPALRARAIRSLPFDGTLVLTAIAPEGTWGLALGDRGEVLEGWILRREDLALQQIVPLGSLTLPRLRPIQGGFQIDSLWEPFSFQIQRDRWIRQEIRQQGPGPLAERIIEAICRESEAGIPSCGELMGSSPPLADRFRWRIGVESSGSFVCCGYFSDSRKGGRDGAGGWN